jgi:hypothetical protein
MQVVFNVDTAGGIEWCAAESQLREDYEVEILFGRKT